LISVHKYNQNRSRFLKALTLFSVFVFILLPFEAYAQSFRKIICDRYEIPFDVTVDFMPGSINYIFNKSTDEMMIYQSGSRDQWIRDYLGMDPSKVPYGTPIKTNGLTDAKFSLKSNITTTVRSPDRDKNFVCAYVKQINVQIGYTNTIIIPDEYEKDSCDFLERVKYHEKYYIADLETGKNFSTILRQNMFRLVSHAEKSAGYMRYTDESALRNKLEQSVKELLEFYLRDLKRQQRQFILEYSSEEQMQKLAENIEKCEADRKKNNTPANQK